MFAVTLPTPVSGFSDAADGSQDRQYEGATGSQRPSETICDGKIEKLSQCYRNIPVSM